MQAIIIEKAQQIHSKIIIQFQIKMAVETENMRLDPVTVKNGVQFIFDEPSRGFYVIAKDETKEVIASLLILKEWSDWRNGDVWWIHSVYVIPKFRNKNVFKTLFKYVEQLALNSDIKGLRLYVDKSNKIAQQVYIKLNMTNKHYEMFEKMFS